MRLWSLHPSFLDAKGLVALWREALLAQHVLHGLTKGYKHHPQLQRFYACKVPETAIAAYLSEVQKEAQARGYNFDRTKVMVKPGGEKIFVTEGQMAYELKHLREKLRKRDPEQLKAITERETEPHPLFSVVKGDIETWEKI